VLKNPEVADRIRANGFRDLLRKYDWERIAERTMGVYQLALTAAPRPAAPQLRLPFFRFEQHPEEVKILLLMHIIGAVNEENAKRPAELAELLEMDVAKVHDLLRKLLVSGYVVRFKDSLRRFRYYLSRLGIVKVCSVFS
jgi:predicted transcriptional regulator